MNIKINKLSELTSLIENKKTIFENGELWQKHNISMLENCLKYFAFFKDIEGYIIKDVILTSFTLIGKEYETLYLGDCDDTRGYGLKFIVEKNGITKEFFFGSSDYDGILHEGIDIKENKSNSIIVAFERLFK